MSHIRNTGKLLDRAHQLHGRKTTKKWEVIAVATKTGYEKGDGMKPLPKIDWARAAIEERKISRGDV